MADYTVSELTKLVRDSFASYDAQGTTHWTWESAARDLPYQVGSLTKIMSQLAGERWADGKSKPELETAFQDELADILAEVLYIASERGIDMSAAMEAMVESDRKKVSSRTNNRK